MTDTAVFEAPSLRAEALRRARPSPRQAAEAARQVDLYLGRRLRALRAERGLTQQALGRAMGLSYQQMQKYETAANRISAGRLHRLAEVLGVPVTALLPDGVVAGQAALDHGGRERGVIRIAELARGLSPTQRSLVASVIEALVVLPPD